MALAEVALKPTARAASCSDLVDDNSSAGSQSEESEVSSCGLQPSRSEMELSQGKDSGIDCGSDVSLPDEETCQKILETVEFYFSDANIIKDQFLLKHLRRNKEGYVSLKLVSSFRKVRSLCRNWRAVAESIKKSDLLALNSEGTKVRRVAPLPAAFEKMRSRTVLVYGLCSEKLSVEAFNEIFSKCGDIALIRVLKSGNPASTEVQKVLGKNPDVLSKGCGLIEFEEVEGARQALAMDTGKENGMRVLSVGNEGTGKDGQPASGNEGTGNGSPKKKKKARRSAHGSKTDVKDCANDKSSTKTSGKPRRSSSGSVGYGSSGSSGYLSSSPADSWFVRRHSYNVPCSSRLEPASSTSFASLKNRGHHKGSKDRLGGKNSETETSAGKPGSQSPWRLRRELMRNELSASSPCLNAAVPLIRLPRGPDGTRGFQSRARQALPSTAE